MIQKTHAEVLRHFIWAPDAETFGVIPRITILLAGLWLSGCASLQLAQTAQPPIAYGAHCGLYPDSVWCGAPADPIPYKSLGEIHALTLSRFDYVSDIDLYGWQDYWSSHGDDVLSGRGFAGDCDNFALTACELAHRAGHQDVSIVLAWTETGEYHAVCAVDDRILDNRYAQVMPVHRLPYRWHIGMAINEPWSWRYVFFR